jgi:hypothetical protein
MTDFVADRESSSLRGMVAVNGNDLSVYISKKDTGHLRLQIEHPNLCAEDARDPLDVDGWLVNSLQQSLGSPSNA